MVSEHEITREAARILPKLAKDDGYLSLVKGTADAVERVFGVFTRRNDYRRPVLKVTGHVVDGILRRGWLEQKDDRLTLNDAGSAWVRRRRAPSQPYREQHQPRTAADRNTSGTHRPVIVNEAESPLGWLRRRKDREGTPLIDARQFEAGERLRADFWRAHMTPKVTADWEGQAPSKRTRRSAPEGPAVFSDKVLAARQRVIQALEAVGPELAGVLIDVCCHHQGLSEAEKHQGWPQRSGKVLLQIALTRLARHYGLLEEERDSRQLRAKLRHWGAEDYRPSLNYWR